MKIVEIKENSKILYKRVNELLYQLSEGAVISNEKLQKLIENDNSSLFVAKDENNHIMAMATLVFYDIPTGRKTWIEDVVVDTECRGQGIGKKIVEEVLLYAQKKGITKIDLTSSYKREEANSLYQKLGFQKRKSNLYRLIIN